MRWHKNFEPLAGPNSLPTPPLPTRPHPLTRRIASFRCRSGATSCAGGSLYWVIKSLVQVRQPLLISPKAPGAWRALLPVDPDELID